jgi:single-stranded-DNA-specific exonuclease
VPRYRWVEPSQTAAGLDLAGLGLVGDILAARGIRTMSDATRFLEHRLDLLPDPSTLPDIEISAARIHQAIRQGERIAVFGDYDVDGVTSAALLTTVLTDLGASVQPLLPHRERDGYGLNLAAVDKAAAGGCRVLITVDCGSGNAIEIQAARSRGIDTIVIDHHHVSSNDLPAAAFVSPKRSDSSHQFGDYAAVGVAYQVLRYLTDDRGLERFLPLVAVGTVADVVPLVGPNRAIVHHGLDRFRDHANPGLQALARSAGLHNERLTSHHIGFMLGPRINAAGRINDPWEAFELLMTDSPDRAIGLADRLSSLNVQRQDMLDEAVTEARTIVEMDGMHDQPVLVLHSPDWKLGLVGLVASRLSEQYGRPVFALEQKSPLSRGSARSIDEFNVVSALESCADLLEEFGGHSKAAGMTISTNRIGEFTERINQVFRERVGDVLPVPEKVLDAELTPGDVSLDLVAELSRLEPYGHGNPAPSFLMRDVQIAGAKRSRNQAHLLFNVMDRGGNLLRAVSFGSGDRLAELGALRQADLALSLRPNTWQGRTDVTLEVHDFRPATGRGIPSGIADRAGSEREGTT